MKQLIFKGKEIEYEDVSEASFMSNEEKTFYPVMIERSDVEKGKVQPYINAFEKIEKKKTKAQGSVAFIFDGYNDDPREIFKIPEIRNWMQRFIKIKPHLFYFLSNIDQNNTFMFYCLAELDVKEYRQNPLTQELEFGLRLESSAKSLIERLTTSAVAYAKKLKEPPAAQFDLGNRLMEQLNYDSIIDPQP